MRLGYGPNTRQSRQGWQRLGALALLVLVACVAPTGSQAGSDATGVSTVSSAVEAQPTTTTVPATTTTLWSDPGYLLVLGDWGSGSKAETDVARAMAQYTSGHQVTAILTTGDNFYSDAAESLMAPLQWALDDGIDFWITWGNHDVETKTRIAAVKATFNPPRWVTRTWGALDILTLDSNQIDSARQRAFLTTEMAKSTRPTIVTFHHPAYSCSKHGDTRDIIDSWVPLFDQDVVLVLNGHDHNYQRFESDGVTYVVTGGGGKSVYGLGDCGDGHPIRLAGGEEFHFLAVHQIEHLIEVEAINVDGVTFDSFQISLD